MGLQGWREMSRCELVGRGRACLTLEATLIARSLCPADVIMVWNIRHC